MRVEKIAPSERLRPYIKYFSISENSSAQKFKVLPCTGLVRGFQYRGNLSVIEAGKTIPLSTAGITGISDHYKHFIHEASISTLLVFFTETGLAHFSNTPAHELFNLSISLDHVFDKNKLCETEEKLSACMDDAARIKTIEHFLLSVLKEKKTDMLIARAVTLIYESKGTIRIKELNEKLFISQSPFEKRFRRLVGTTPKKFASIVRLNTVMNQIGQNKSLREICYENDFFDSAHFSKSFKQFTGDAPKISEAFYKSTLFYNNIAAV